MDRRILESWVRAWGSAVLNVLFPPPHTCWMCGGRIAPELYRGPPGLCASCGLLLQTGDRQCVYCGALLPHPLKSQASSYYHLCLRPLPPPFAAIIALGRKRGMWGRVMQRYAGGETGWVHPLAQLLADRLRPQLLYPERTVIRSAPGRVLAGPLSRSVSRILTLPYQPPKRASSSARFTHEVVITDTIIEPLDPKSLGVSPVTGSRKVLLAGLVMAGKRRKS